MKKYASANSNLYTIISNKFAALDKIHRISGVNKLLFILNCDLIESYITRKYWLHITFRIHYILFTIYGHGRHIFKNSSRNNVLSALLTNLDK